MLKWLKQLKEERGFTLVEMLVVVIIIGILLLIVITNIGGVEETAREETGEAVVATVESQWLIYRMEQIEDPGATVQVQLLVNEYISQEQADAYEEAIIRRDPDGD